jgi:hypothetical protein
MYPFAALDDVISTLDRLSERQPPLVAVLPRQPGTKESRYLHLFAGDAPPSDEARTPPPADRLAQLEDAVHQLRSEVADMHRQLDAFRKQFE